MATTSAAPRLAPRLAALAPLEAARAIREGLPVGHVDAITREGLLTLAEIDHVILPRKTLSHRRKAGALTKDQSDRLFRVARVLDAAGATFGSADKAHRWLRRPTLALGGEAPLDLLDTGEGIRLVEDLLARIDHGLAA